MVFIIFLFTIASHLSNYNSIKSVDIDWQMFRHDVFHTGFINKTGNISIPIIRWIFLANDSIHSSPAIGDIDNDGYIDIVFGSFDGNLYAINGTNGIKKWNYSTKDAPIFSSPAIGDIDNDGKMEIAFGDLVGKFHCLDSMGNLKWQIQDGKRVLPSPAIVDINNDGKFDIIFGNHIGYLIAINATGNETWSIDGFDDIHSSPAIGDIDKDGFVEIVFGSMNGNLYAIDSPPDLLINKIGYPENVYIGGQINYTIVYANRGGMPATGVNITDLLPNGLTYAYAIPPPNEICNHTLIWHIGNLDQNESGIIYVIANVTAPPQNGNYTNYVNITCEQNISDEDAEITGYISEAADLYVYKIDDPDPVYAGGMLSYIIYVGNNGPFTAHNITVKDYLPEGVLFLTAYPPASGPNPLIWHFGSKNPGWSQTIYLYLLVLRNNGTLINNVSITSDTIDIDLSNNEYTEYTNVTPLAELIIDKEDSKDPVKPGEYLEYIINVTNYGPSDAFNVNISDILPSFASFNFASPTPNISNGKLCWLLQSLEAGESFTIIINVSIASNASGILINYANVTSSTYDPNMENNEAYEYTSIESISLHIMKQSIPSVTEPGGVIMYEIIVKNSGATKVTDVVVREEHNENIIIISSNPPIQNNTWYISQLNASEFIKIYVYAKVFNATDGDILSNYVNVTCAEGAYDEAQAYVAIKLSPPYTYKIFYGKVVNVTVWDSENPYILHYILNTTLIDLAAVDNGSGVNKTFYRIFKLENGWNLLFDWHEYGWKSYPYCPINLAELGNLYNFSPCGKYQIEFYSIDNVGNVEEVKWNDVFVDCYSPISIIEPICPYEISNRSVEIIVNATDIGIGIEKVALYYRYSLDNISWSNWTLYDIKIENYSFEFTAINDGYYQFYSVAYDKLGNHEILPNASTMPKAYCKISYPYDINKDGKVNIQDLIIVAQHFGMTPASENWMEEADLNKDDVINILDILLIIKHWTG